MQAVEAVSGRPIKTGQWSFNREMRFPNIRSRSSCAPNLSPGGSFPEDRTSPSKSREIAMQTEESSIEALLDVIILHFACLWRLLGIVYPSQEVEEDSLRLPLKGEKYEENR